MLLLIEKNILKDIHQSRLIIQQRIPSVIRSRSFKETKSTRRMPPGSLYALRPFMCTIACILYDHKKSRNAKKYRSMFYFKHDQRNLLRLQMANDLILCPSLATHRYCICVSKYLLLYTSFFKAAIMRDVAPHTTLVPKIRISQKLTANRKVQRISDVTVPDISLLTIRVPTNDS